MRREDDGFSHNHCALPCLAGSPALSPAKPARMYGQQFLEQRTLCVCVCVCVPHKQNNQIKACTHSTRTACVHKNTHTYRFLRAIANELRAERHPNLFGARTQTALHTCVENVVPRLPSGVGNLSIHMDDVDFINTIITGRSKHYSYW